MPVHPFLRTSAFDPDDLKAMAAAFEEALRRLVSQKRPDVSPDLVARKIIALAKDGERDPQRLCDGAVSSFDDGDAAAS